jgi:hypothetical protein
MFMPTFQPVGMIRLDVRISIAFSVFGGASPPRLNASTFAISKALLTLAFDLKAFVPTYIARATAAMQGSKNKLFFFMLI